MLSTFRVIAARPTAGRRGALTAIAALAIAVIAIEQGTALPRAVQQPSTARMRVAASMTRLAWSAVSFLPLCAFVSLISALSAPQAAALSPDRTGLAAAWSFSKRLVPGPG